MKTKIKIRNNIIITHPNMLLFLVYDFAISAAFRLSIWVVQKTCNGVACIADAAVAAYSYSTNNVNKQEQLSICGDSDNSNDFLDCVIVSNYE